MIDGGPRSASVIAVADCMLSFVSRARFQKHADADPGLLNYLVKTLTRRMREADDGLRARLSKVTDTGLRARRYIPRGLT